jgi:hypothetical protein
MKSQVLNGPIRFYADARDWQLRIPAMVITLRDVIAVLGALAVVVVAVLLAAWMSTIGSGNALAGSTWGAAIVFAALAVDGRGMKALVLALTATVLMVLAWLQLSLAAGFVILAAALVAPWPAAEVFRRLR